MISIKQSIIIVMVLLPAKLLMSLPVGIVPQPLQMEVLPGSFHLGASFFYNATGNCNKEAFYLQQQLKAIFGIAGGRTTSKQATVRLKINTQKSKVYGKEGYELIVDGAGVQLTAAEPSGIFYAVQSLLQLIVKKDDGGYEIPFVRIADSPRFKWRAFLLDEARRFKGKAIVEALLDEMAALKMNTFHWHLTDDQGWRIEIKKYPALTGIGSKRIGTQVRGSDKLDGESHAGYYTQDEIKAIVQYAKERHIVVIPEIEMPGHASAAIAAYSWLGATGRQIEVPGMFGVFYDVFNVAEVQVRKFLEDVVAEVMPLFPSGVVHIGGDEVKFDQWKASETVNAFIKKQGLRSPADLQVWFTNHMSNFISKKGGRMMGWNDIMGGKLHEYNDNEDTKLSTELSPSTIVHFWKGDTQLIMEAIQKGHDVVNSFHEYTYLDYSYQQISLQKAYSFEPVPSGIDNAYQKKILGLGCQMWGEWIPTTASMNYQIFPRLAAYAEVGWTAATNKNFDRFKQSLRAVITRWQQRGIEVDSTTIQ